jgi:hypothetical protein
LNWTRGRYPFTPATKTQVANPTSFVAQKILIHHERDYKDRAKNLLYVHDTIESFSEHLGELSGINETDIRPRLHANRIAELTEAGGELFGKVNDTIREAALIASGRKVSAETLAETCRAGLKEIFGWSSLAKTLLGFEIKNLRRVAA